jgi:hypothetical protein
MPFNSQVQTLGPTSSGAIVGEWSKETLFPWENDNNQIWFFMLNKIQTHIMTSIFHLVTPQSKDSIGGGAQSTKNEKVEGKYQVPIH